MRLLFILGAAGLVLLLGGLAVFIGLREPPDSPSHIAAECRFLGALEARRMVRWQAYGPAPAIMWRAEGRTSGAARLDRDGSRSARLPKSLEANLIQWLAPKGDLPSIDCTKAFDAMRIPALQRYNEHLPAIQDVRRQYSRVTFLPGHQYALLRVSECHRVNDRWDHDQWTQTWRRRGADWELEKPRVIDAVMRRPRFELPTHCFDPAYK